MSAGLRDGAGGLRRGDNPARWKGPVHLVAERVAPIEHFAAMAYRDVPAFVAELRALAPAPGGRAHLFAARALEFLILTAARTGEVIGARWSEIDFISKVWVVPLASMKAGVEHCVPLSDRAVELLSNMPHVSDSDFVFAVSLGWAPAGDQCNAKAAACHAWPRRDGARVPVVV